jgi:hypothetical protein
MSSRLVKRQLSHLASESTPQQPASLQPQSKAAKKKLRKAKAKALKARAAAAAKDPKQVYQKNLHYFKSTKGPQGETAELMNKARAPPRAALRAQLPAPSGARSLNRPFPSVLAAAGQAGSQQGRLGRLRPVKCREEAAFARCRRRAAGRRQQQ